MPDDGEFGYLTTAQWEWFRWAVSYSLALVPFLRSAGNYSISVDEGRASKTEPALGMPATQIAAIEIEKLAARMGEWGTLEDIANDVEGWQIAVGFTREVRTASERWPMEDKPHQVEDVRCTACGMAALVYAPPTLPKDEVSVSCTECGAKEDSDAFSVRVELTRLQVQAQKKAGRM
ncbi:MAG: hypothetical protein ACTH31_16960 [Pseudoclavibacter sp.]